MIMVTLVIQAIYGTNKGGKYLEERYRMENSVQKSLPVLKG
jgi:hypothetical protein